MEEKEARALFKCIYNVLEEMYGILGELQEEIKIIAACTASLKEKASRKEAEQEGGRK